MGVFNRNHHKVPDPFCFTNTLSGKKEPLEPVRPPGVSLYVCGVTVYDDCHIGHARGAVVFDVLRRYLEFKGHPVTHVRNITDVDDKIIERARREVAPGGDLKSAARDVAARYTDSFRSDFARLGLLPPTWEPKATEFIPQMADFIERLVKQGAAYKAADGVYFSVRKLPEYGRLSHQNLDKMLEGAEAEAGEGKKDPLDFALWKKAKPEEPSWPSPWGPGRPGWHIECAAMSTHLLGDTFDIHGGGQDLIFPHHENERAEALGAGKEFARVWLHNGLLTVNGQKMSKSLGNFVMIEKALEKHPADVLRFFFLSAHYRSPLDFTWERLNEAAHALERLNAFLARADALERDSSATVLSDKVKETGAAFDEAMEDDLNTPRALAALFELVGQVNDNQWLEKALMKPAARAAGEQIRRLGGVLGFFQTSQPVDAQAQEWVRQRDDARRNKDFQKADEIRKQLVEQGWIVEDAEGKTIVRKRV